MVNQPRTSLVNRLVETDHRGRILYATPEAGAVFGISSRDLVGRDLISLFHDERQLRNVLRAVIANDRPMEVATVTNESKVEIRMTATRLDARRVRWRLVRADES
jgi:PAS domain S-box-containing protein